MIRYFLICFFILCQRGGTFFYLQKIYSHSNSLSTFSCAWYNTCRSGKNVTKGLIEKVLSWWQLQLNFTSATWHWIVQCLCLCIWLCALLRKCRLIVCIFFVFLINSSISRLHHSPFFLHFRFQLLLLVLSDVYAFIA